MAVATAIVNLPFDQFETAANGLSNADWADTMEARLQTLQVRVQQQEEARQQRASFILASGGIRRNGTGWYVESQSQPHTFYWTDGTRCTCADWKNRQPVGGCKHMRALALHLAEKAALKAQAQQDIIDIWG